MFGLLDSVKQALGLKCSQDEDKKTEKDSYGKNAVRTMRSLWAL